MKSKIIELVCITALLSAALVFVFWDVIDSSYEKEFLGAGDSWMYAGPIQFFNDTMLDQGVFPQWNPLMFAGQPHTANPLSFLLYPPNLLRSYLTSEPTPYKTHIGIIWMTFLHMLVGGLGQFLLARRYGLSIPAACVAVMVFELSAPSVSRAIGHWFFLFPVVWLPWMLWAGYGLASSSKWSERIRSLLICSVLYGLVILGGSPHYSMLVGLFLGAYVLLSRWFLTHSSIDSETPATNSAESRFNTTTAKAHFVELGVSITSLGLLCLLAILIALPLALPALEFSGHTYRGTEKEVVIGSFNVPDMSKNWNALTKLVVYSGDSNYEGLKGAGACAVILAALALFHSRRREVAIFAILFLIFWDGSHDGSLFLWRFMHAIAPYTLDSPGRAMLIACLPLGILAGFGLDAVLQLAGDKRKKRKFAGFIVAIVTSVYFILWRNTHPHPYLEVPFLSSVAPLVLGAILLAGLFLSRPHLFGVLGAAVLLIEISVWSRSSFLPSVMPEAILYNKSMDALHEPQQFWSDNARGTFSNPNEPIYRLEPAINGYDPLHIQAVREFISTSSSINQNHHVVSNMEVTGYNMRGLLLMKRPFWLSRQFVNAEPLPASTKFPVATTTFLHTNMPLPVSEVQRSDLNRASVSNGFGRIPLHDRDQGKIKLKTSLSLAEDEVLRLVFTKPKLHTTMVLAVSSDCEAELWSYIGDKKSLQNDGTQHIEMGAIYGLKPSDGSIRYIEIPLPDYEEVQFAMIAQSENPGTVTIHEIFLAVDRNDETEHLTIMHRDANSVRVKVDNIPGPRILTFLDANYEGWTATLDGVEVPIIQAYEVFKAVSVPAGSHTIEFKYRDPKFWLGLYISLFTLIMITICWVVTPRFLDR